MPFPLIPRCAECLTQPTVIHPPQSALTSSAPKWSIKDSEATTVRLEGEKSMFESWLCDLGSFHLSFWVSVFLMKKERIKPKGGSTGRQHQQHLGSLRTTAPGPHPGTIARDFPGDSWRRIGLRNTGLDYFWVLPANELLMLCCCSVAKSCLTLCDLMNYSTPGFPVLHYLLEFAQIHVHWVGDAIQPSHPVTLFSSCPWSFLESGSFPMS